MGTSGENRVAGERKTTSYFRTGGGRGGTAYAFFDDEDHADTERAFAAISAAARELGGRNAGRLEPARIGVYRPPLYPGPWDLEAHLVGFRSARDLRKLAEAPSVVAGMAKFEAQEELSRLERLVSIRRGAAAKVSGPVPGS